MVEYEMHLPFIMLSQMYVQIGKISLEASAKDFKRGENRVKGWSGFSSSEIFLQGWSI